MKKLFILSAVIAASFIATTGYSQVFVGARIGLRLPAPRVYIAAPAPVVYGDTYAADGYYAAPAICEADFPGYAYYDYPAWNGHYRDRFYFAHYRPFFERDHAAYFNHGRFDHERFEHERINRGYGDRGYANRGYGDRGHNDHGFDHRRGR
jgi:hypothetical protein